MHGFAALLTSDGLLSLVTLSVLEIVLGIDNLVMIAILVARLDPQQQPLARKLGLSLAMVTRIMLLTTMSTLARLKQPLFTVPYIMFECSGRDLVLMCGGAFLIYKATKEIHEKLEEGSDDEIQAPKNASLGSIIVQIVFLDIIFSLDSVITAVGVADELIIMILAVILAVLLMLWFSGAISEFINDHPSIKMLALSFLLLIGVLLLADGTHHHIEKGYIYFAMGFAFAVEMLNLRTTRAKRNKRLSQETPPASDA